MFNNSSVDLQIIANIFGIRIAVFEFGGQINPRWSWIYPDPNMSSQITESSRPDMWLFHERSVHYDLLINRPAPTSHPEINQPSVSSSRSESLAVTEDTGSTTTATASLIAESLAMTEDIPVTTATETLSATESSTFNDYQPTSETTYSPMTFMTCPRGPGRPKTKRFGEPSVNKSKRKIDSDAALSSAPPPKKRGRPPGSKNKPKSDVVPTTKKGRPLGSKNKTKSKLESAGDSLHLLRKASAAAYRDISVEDGNPTALCFCETTQWRCSVCKIKCCDMCTTPEEAEELSKRRCLGCID